MVAFEVWPKSSYEELRPLVERHVLLHDELVDLRLDMMRALGQVVAEIPQPECCRRAYR